MKGANKNNGSRLSGLDHLRQSITDILTTPIGSRIMRRDYGSRLHDLVDQPMNPSLIMQIYVATAEAIDRWEPRLRLESVRAASVQAGEIEIELLGYYRHNGQEIVLRGIVVS